MIKNLLFICLTIFNFYCRGQNFAVSYGFADVTTSSGTVDPSIAPTLAGLSCGSFSALGTSSNPSASGRFSYTGWPLGGSNGSDDYSNFTGALSPTVYYQVTLSPDPGYTLSLSSATFTMRRSGTGIREYCMRSDLDNYINNLAAGTGTTTKLSVIPGDVFFWNYDSVSTSSDQRGSELVFGNAFTNIDHPITFRIYAWNAESSGGSFSIDNFSFMGALSNGLSDQVGLQNQLHKPSFNMYPNPSTDGRFSLENTGTSEKLEVYSHNGALVFTTSLKQEIKTHLLDLSFLESGLYQLKIHSDNSTILKKLAILKK